MGNDASRPMNPNGSGMMNGHNEFMGFPSGSAHGKNPNNNGDGSNSGSGASSNNKSSYMELLQNAGQTLTGASGAVCGSINDAFDESKSNPNNKIKSMSSNKNIISSSSRENGRGSKKKKGFESKIAFSDAGGTNSILMTDNDGRPMSPEPNPMSELFARALISEVTDNPNTMNESAMAEREKKLIRSQQRAAAARQQKNSHNSNHNSSNSHNNNNGNSARAIGGSDLLPTLLSPPIKGSKPSSSSNNHNSHRITIGLSLSRRDSSVGHPDTVTRQTAFDLNELQDRDYKYVSSTDANGWRAGGGEPGGGDSPGGSKSPSVDTVHIPIIHMECDSASVVDSVIAALARGEVFIPHMSILPESLGVNGASPPDLVLNFGCERNDDVPPEEWPNWCLEFMHNQLYEYFVGVAGAQWSPRPAFQITLANKVRWKTVKHMNKYFAHAERAIQSWREGGPQYLDPQLSYIEGGATPEEVAHPHGIYLIRNGVPTNYFPPNFEPPYTTKMTRSLLNNVISKSWDKKKRDWTSQPVPRLATPAMIFSTMCGCSATNIDHNQHGFIPSEATNHNNPNNTSTITTTNNTITNHHHYHNNNNNNNNSNNQNNNDGFDLPPQSPNINNTDNTTTNNHRSPDFLSDDDTWGDSFPISPQPMNSNKNSNQHNNNNDMFPMSSSRFAGEAAFHSSFEKNQHFFPSDTTPTNNKNNNDDHNDNFNFVPQSPRNSDSARSQSSFAEELLMANTTSMSPSSEKENSPKKKKKPKPETTTTTTNHAISNTATTPRSSSTSGASSRRSKSKNKSKGNKSSTSRSPSSSSRQTKSNKHTTTATTTTSSTTTNHSKNISESQVLRKQQQNLEEYKFSSEEDPSSSNRFHNNNNDDDDFEDDQRSISKFEEDMAMSRVGAESIGGAVSIGESHTTIPHMNSSKFMEQDHDMRKQRDTDRALERKKVEVLEQAIQEKLRNTSSHKKEDPPLNSKADNNIHTDTNSKDPPGHRRSKSRKKDKKDKKRDKEEKRREKEERKKEKKKNKSKDKSLSAFRRGTSTSFTNNSNQSSHHQDKNNMIAEESEAEAALSMNNNNKNKVLSDNFSPTKPSSTYLPANLNVMEDNNNKRQPSSSVSSKVNKKVEQPILNENSQTFRGFERSNSNISMDYSQDSASMLGDGSLIGGQFAGDGSVVTLNSNANQSLLSCVTRTTVHELESNSSQKNASSTSHQPLLPSATDDDNTVEDDISLSILETTSSTEPVPTDEELFAVGWAKALDPNSGSYYYFTLDRTKIVWDNPLSNSSE